MQTYFVYRKETHINTNSKEEKEGYTFIFSTGVSEEDRDKKKARKGKGKGRSLEGMENAGVGMVISNKAKRSLIDFEQINGRIMWMKFKAQGNPIYIYSIF